MHIIMSLAVLLALSSVSVAEVGRASWYMHGSKTANGERFNPNGLTAAHRKLKFGTKVKVENLKNGKSVIVRINDRGPFVGGRIIDLSRGAFSKIAALGSGTARVRITILRR